MILFVIIIEKAILRTAFFHCQSNKKRSFHFHLLRQFVGKPEQISTIRCLLSDPEMSKALWVILLDHDLNEIKKRTFRVTRPLWNEFLRVCLMLAFWPQLRFLFKKNVTSFHTELRDLRIHTYSSYSEGFFFWGIAIKTTNQRNSFCRRMRTRCVS